MEKCVFMVNTVLSSQKNQFYLEEGISYLNQSYISPLLKRVEKVGVEGMKQARHPYRMPLSHFFNPSEELRKVYAELIGADEPRRIVLIPSVSYGMANVARNVSLAKGEKIVVTAEQFPSNIYPWQRLAQNQGGILEMVAVPKSAENRAKAWNEAILDAIDEKTKLVAIGNVHWADGTIFDLMRIREKTRKVGALLVIDGTQSVGALPLDVSKVQPDALVCAGYKWMMGPYAIGMAYYGPYFDGGNPIEENWINRLGSEDFRNLVNYQEAYHPFALRYEVGEHSNFILLPMMLEALKQIKEWGIENIQQYCRDLVEGPIAELKALGCQINEAPYRSGHMFGLRLADSQAMERFRDLIQENRIYLSIRGDVVRVAVYMYNEAEDLQKLIACIKQL